MLKELLVDIALLAGPKVTFVRTTQKPAGINLKTDQGYVPAISETDYIEARPYGWQKAIAAHALGTSLQNIGTGGANRVADRFTWRTEDHENFDNIMERERQRGVYPDELRSDVSAALRHPAMQLEIAQSAIVTAQVEIRSVKATPDKTLMQVRLTMAQNHWRRAQKDQRRSAHRVRFMKKVLKLLCISIENPVPSRKVHRLRPADPSIQMEPLTL